MGRKELYIQPLRDEFVNITIESLRHQIVGILDKFASIHMIRKANAAILSMHQAPHINCVRDDNSLLYNLVKDGRRRPHANSGFMFTHVNSLIRAGIRVVQGDYIYVITLFALPPLDDFLQVKLFQSLLS